MITVGEFSLSQEQVIDITAFVQQQLSDMGICTVIALDTHSAIILSSVDGKTDADICSDMERAFPARCSYNANRDPLSTEAEVISAGIGMEQSIPFNAGKLLLGQNQSVRLLALGARGCIRVAVLTMK